MRFSGAIVFFTPCLGFNFSIMALPRKEYAMSRFYSTFNYVCVHHFCIMLGIKFLTSQGVTTPWQTCFSLSLLNLSRQTILKKIMTRKYSVCHCKSTTHQPHSSLSSFAVRWSKNEKFKRLMQVLIEHWARLQLHIFCPNCSVHINNPSADHSQLVKFVSQ